MSDAQMRKTAPHSSKSHWLEGKNIPKVMDILPSVTSAENIKAYEADLRNPAGVYADEKSAELLS